MANDYITIARRAAEKLNKNGVRLIQNPELTIVPIAFHSAEETTYFHKQLLDEGYSVGKINFKGKDYETNGIRIVITPKVNSFYMYSSAMDLCDKIEKLISKV